MDHFGIFAKFWSPGKVKTRLGASIGLDQSALVYQAMLSDLVGRLQSVGDRRTVVYTPQNAEDAFLKLTQSTGNQWNLATQCDGPLGQRMTQFFQTTFAEKSTRNVVLIGSDCPTITPATCDLAWAALRHNDVVLGPTLDGGYYLIGMSEKFCDVFSGITYSTESVLDQTIALMKQRELKFELLPQLQDIDELPQLQQLQRWLSANAHHSDQTQLFNAIETVLASKGQS